MQFQIHRSCDRGSALHTQWSALARSPLEHPDWLLTWWECWAARHADCELFLVTVRDASSHHDRIVAVAPLYFEAGTVKLLGSGDVCTDHQELLIGDVSFGTVQLFLQWLLDDNAVPAWDGMVCEHIDTACTTHQAILRCEAQSSAAVYTKDDVGSCRVALPATWDDYLSQLSKNHRKRCRRWTRGYFDTGRAVPLSTCDGWSIEEALSVFFRLHEQRQGAGRTDLTAEPFRNFLTTAFRRLSSTGRAELSALIIEDELMAVELELHGIGATYAYQSGMSAAGEAHSAGSLSVLSRIRRAIDRGHSIYDFLRGTESYKFHWGAELVPAARMKLWQPNWRGRLARSTNLLCDSTLSFAGGIVAKGSAAFFAEA